MSRARAGRFAAVALVAVAHQDCLEKNPAGYSCHYLRDVELEPPARP